MTAQNYRANESIDRIRQGALLAGVIGLAICVIGIVKAPKVFFPSYLIAFMFVLGLSLGSLGLLMLQHLTGGNWGIVIRRPLESATRVLAVVAVLFVPIFFGMNYLYGAWLTAPTSGEGALSEFQRSYLTLNGFRVRAILYFAVWGILVFLFNRWSREQDANPEDGAVRRRFKILAGPGIILYVFVMTFAAIDWVMSLSPHWASTIYGFLFVAGQLISSMSLMIAIVVLLARSGPLSGILQPRHIHDMGKLLLAFVMLWAYFEFSQLLIIWSGNQPEEISFYYSRLRSQWGVVAVIVLIFHFFVPFFLLLSRDLKRNPKLLPGVAIWLILMRLVDLFWYIRPEFTKLTPTALPNIWDLAAALGVGGLWFFFFAGNLKQLPVLPVGDPKLAEAIATHEH
jgi:hypothetical protein